MHDEIANDNSPRAAALKMLTPSALSQLSKQAFLEANI
jgi:hypothetical protein